MRTESKAPGRDPSQQDYERNHWVAEGRCNHRPIPEKESAHNGASRLAAEVSGHYGALGIVVLRDGVSVFRSGA